MPLNTLFVWFYCLDLDQVTILLVLGTLFYLKIVPVLFSTQGFRKLSNLFLILWVCLVVFSTLFSRSETLSTPQFSPFHSYREALETGNVEIYRSNFMNAVLFYPIGMLLFGSTHNPRKALLWSILLSVMLSTGIEFLQFQFLLGQPEVDDVIHNVLGALSGTGLSWLLDQVWNRCFSKGAS